MKKVFIAIPCMEDVSVDFVKALTRLEKVGNTTINFSVGSLVYASRDNLAESAIKEQADYILWIDSDMVFNSDLLIDMVSYLEQTGEHFVSAVCFRRKPPFNPCIYKKIRMGFGGEAETEAYDDYPTDAAFEIDACGMAACLMTMEMASVILFHEKQLFAPIPGYGEDISFCIRAKKHGYKLWADPKLYVGHIARTVADRSAFDAWRANTNGSRN